MMSTVLIVEDGKEYLEFFQLFLRDEHEYLHAQSGGRALELLEAHEVELIVLDMRFERSPAEDLLGDVEEVAQKYFGGDLARAHRFVEENQGTMILAEVRGAEHEQPVLFVSDMAPRKIGNLRQLYGDVHVVPNFDAPVIRAEIQDALGGDS